MTILCTVRVAETNKLQSEATGIHLDRLTKDEAPTRSRKLRQAAGAAARELS
jgi:hypothetical protein